MRVADAWDVDVLDLGMIITGIHTEPYHAEVASRLVLIRKEPAAAGRAELKAMREDMIAGTFPYLNKKAKKCRSGK